MKQRRTRAEQQQQTREHVLDAAERLFIENGYHATSVDKVAAEAGYTRGAVYSNFASKEDLFLGVYERRSARVVAHIEKVIENAGGGLAGLDAAVTSFTGGRGTRGGPATDDGWLAAFFEFWAQVVRNPELRGRFADIHLRSQEPYVAAITAHAQANAGEASDELRKLVLAGMAMQLTLQLERLTVPELVDTDFAIRMNRMFVAGVIGDRS